MTKRKRLDVVVTLVDLINHQPIITEDELQKLLFMVDDPRDMAFIMKKVKEHNEK